ncbi:pro-sigmaK processing inhibitor BofA family protein [Acidaminococcus sp.]|uniref:pro-sigmaK processing inhibitor BofA family protein n=1 Tax=Acidaminococcus sp. TaxID=1872103 RepID=UPI003D7D1261
MEMWLVAGAALVMLFFVINMFSLSLKLLWNGICGVILVWLFNLVGGIFGATIPINFVSALVAGFFGVPGVILMLLYRFMS